VVGWRKNLAECLRASSLTLENAQQRLTKEILSMAGVQDIPLERIDGSDATLGDYRSKVVLIVNVASKCGQTSQYHALQKLYERYSDRGLVVVGFPANDFAAEEPGTNDEIQKFCSMNFGVTFPMFAKIAVIGDAQHPLYRQLTAAQPKATTKPGSDFRERLLADGLGPKNQSDVLWNFEKFLLGRDGHVVARFTPDVTADDAILTEAIERELVKN
jgi:glutathione peroxidase